MLRLWRWATTAFVVCGAIFISLDAKADAVADANAAIKNCDPAAYGAAADKFRRGLPANANIYDRGFPQLPNPCPPPVTPAFNPSVWIAGGGLFTQKPSSYRSTGTQAPFDTSSSFTDGQFGAGIGFPLIPGVAGPGSNLGLNVGLYNGSGSHTLIAIKRHPGDGMVTLEEKDSLIIDAPMVLNMAIDNNTMIQLVPIPREGLFGPRQYAPETPNRRVKNNPLADGANAYAAAAAPPPWVLSFGVGPTFRHSKLTMTSNQTGAGGSLLSTSDTQWQTGLVVSTGLARAICGNCLAGRPVTAGLEFRARWYPSQTVNLPSPFGFTETGHVGRSTDQSVFFKLATPLFPPK